MIKVAIIGYGNIGRGVKKAIDENSDMKLTAIITRRPEDVFREVGLHTQVLPMNLEKLKEMTDPYDIDVAILCGGSKEDVPIQGPAFAQFFNTVDSFDTHANIPEYYQKMDTSARKAKNVSIISAGWDPGIFSVMRTMFEAFLPVNKIYTFWGPGVSQGHSDAVRKIQGVKDARQYTLLIQEAIDRVRNGSWPKFSKRDMHIRLVYVVPEKGADQEIIEEQIIKMPHYFDEYKTDVVFITEKEMEKDHSSFPHGGFVLASGLTDDNNKQILEFKCKLESNPEFTANVLVACARAVYRMRQEGRTGAFTMLDIPISYFSPIPADLLLAKWV